MKNKKVISTLTYIERLESIEKDMVDLAYEHSLASEHNHAPMMKKYVSHAISKLRFLETGTSLKSVFYNPTTNIPFRFRININRTKLLYSIYRNVKNKPELYTVQISKIKNEKDTTPTK
jgi:hypothetical protein